MVTDRYRIEAAISEVREGYNTADAERVLVNYSDDFGDFTFGMPAMDGNEPKIILRARLLQLFSTHTIKFVPIIITVDIFGETAIARGWHQLTMTAHSSRQVTVLRTRFIEMWHKYADNIWRIKYIMDNPDQPPMMVDDILKLVQNGRFSEATRSFK